MLARQLHLRALHSFLVVAEELNVSRAAERLNVAQPALSQQIRHLEERLGVALLERSARPMRLTEAGQYFRAEAQLLLTGFDRAVGTARQIAEGRRGWLGIGFTRSAMYSILPRAFAAFATRFPEIRLNLHELLTEQQPEALRERMIHIGIARDPPDDGVFGHEVLLEEELVAVLPVGHPLAADTAIDPAVLADQDFIVFPRDARAIFPRLILSICEAAGFVPRVAHRAHEIQTALGLVAAGLGVSFVAASVASQARPDLAFLPLRGPGPVPRSRLVAIYRHGDDSTPLAAVLDILRAQAVESSGRVPRTL